MRPLITLLAFFITFSGVNAQGNEPRPPQHRVGKFFRAVAREIKSPWGQSIAAFVLASIADSHSSIGMREINPLLRSANGRFQKKGVAMKFGGVVSGVVIPQVLVKKKWPNENLEPLFVPLNLSLAGLTGGIAVRNYQIKYR